MLQVAVHKSDGFVSVGPPMLFEFLAVIHLLFNKTCSHAQLILCWFCWKFNICCLLFNCHHNLCISFSPFEFFHFSLFLFFSFAFALSSVVPCIWCFSLPHRWIWFGSWAEHNGEYSAASKPPNQHPPGAYSDAITITISTRSTRICCCIFYALVLLVNCKTLFSVGKIFHLNR